MDWIVNRRRSSEIDQWSEWNQINGRWVIIICPAEVLPSNHLVTTPDCCQSYVIFKSRIVLRLFVFMLPSWSFCCLCFQFKKGSQQLDTCNSNSSFLIPGGSCTYFKSSDPHSDTLLLLKSFYSLKLYFLILLKILMRFG